MLRLRVFVSINILGEQKLGLNLAARNGHAAVAHSIVSGGRAGIAAKEIEHIAVPVPQELHIIAVLRRVKLEIRIAVPRKRERFNGAFFSVYFIEKVGREKSAALRRGRHELRHAVKIEVDKAISAVSDGIFAKLPYLPVLYADIGDTLCGELRIPALAGGKAQWKNKHCE